MIRFLVTRLPKELAVRDIEGIASVLSRALRIKAARDVSVAFVSLKEIHTLNKAYRGKDRPTDVLSFALTEATLPKGDAHALWGDVIICPAYAKDEAKRRGLPLREELVRLLVHGVLHIAGYDHASEADELKMFRLQEQVVERVFTYA